MKLFVEPPKVYLHRDFVDFRKSINGLAAIVETDMALPLMSGALFVFCNKGKDKLKILFWDKTGFALWYKRLEKNKFKWPSKLSSPTYSLSEQQLDWLLSGYDVVGHQAITFESVVL
ncbi:IS66 family insertion sequence element accessory protein TnpB [Aliiglaciecola sp.]|nr:IS66 family insertion sequence element accessory protein TnpB [Aliiglaciecola sp.]